MQKRSSFYVELREISNKLWLPAGREYATLNFCFDACYLLGGLNYDTNREVAQLNMGGIYNYSKWRKIVYKTNVETLQGRCRHSTCEYKSKLYLFGGCYMYNRKR